MANRMADKIIARAKRQFQENMNISENYQAGTTQEPYSSSQLINHFVFYRGRYL